MKLPRELDPVGVRVLGCLLEKEQTTPEYYPLTLNALVAACCQRSNREPVMNLTLADVRSALGRLQEDVLVWASEGARSERWRHALDRRWELEPAAKAVMTLLLLRGPQTPGELRGRSDRMHFFRSTAEVEAVLEGLAGGDEPLVMQRGRRPGQKEARWAHLVSGPPADEPVAPPDRVTGGDEPSLRDRVSDLEQRVARLETALQRLGQ